MASPESFKTLLDRLVQTPEYFTADDLKQALNHLRPDSLAAAAAVLRDRSLKATVEEPEGDFIVDIVGTGGDGYNLFNVSTTAAIVAAGAGARVIKRAQPIPRVPFTFILAPHYHPALAFIAPYRKALPFRTMFNILGPLINPARPQGMVLGIAEPQIGHTFALSLREGGVKRALVVCGYEKLDEISCAGPTYAWELHDGEITEKTLRPEVFGLDAHPLSTVAGGSPQENADTFRKLLTSGKEIPQSLKPVLDFSITSGKAWAALESFRETGDLAVAAFK
ncbi:glycosyl transferase [Mycena olivaceomarginata]|nr:glycosyl transferase [Mycena olivaceomarginata]